MTYKEIEERGLAYKYVRGSMLYGTNIPGSDLDYGGVFIAPEDDLYGLRSKYVEQVSDAKSDITYYELGRWVELLANGNPNILEGLFAPDDKIIGPVHPAIQYIKDRKEMFLSKRCFATLSGYAIAQIKKARGLNKKIVNPITERKDLLDFCYVFNKQGSIPVKEWLEKHGLFQKYCGLVSVPNMREAFAIFYDFGAHFSGEEITEGRFIKACEDREGNRKNKIINFVESFEAFTGRDLHYRDVYSDAYKYIPGPFGYKGMVGDDGLSNELRCSSIIKGELPICHMTCNVDAYTKHCKDYREYKEWEKNRNPVRYESNLNKNYDAKNVSHCVRLIHMGLELAQGKGYNVVRTEDRQFLIDIRNHKYEYDEIIDYIEKKKEELNEFEKTCTLPETVDMEKIDELLKAARGIAYFEEVD